jgi:DNA repair exonuclease SbcCD ATPase subunit
VSVVDLYRDVDRAIGVKRAERDAAESEVARTADQLRGATAEVDELTAAVDLLRKASDSVREQVRVRVESVVRHALRAVFGAGLDFRIEQEVKRGTVNMRAMVGYVQSESETHWTAANSGVGGGVADVVSFAMRVAFVAALSHRVPKVIVADEPFKHVSSQYLPRVAQMLKVLADQTGVQLVIVSHEPEIAEAADKMIELAREGGKTVVL